MKRTIWFLLLAVAMMGSAWTLKTTAQSAGCAPSGGLNFVCGVQAAEDLVLVPNTKYLIGSGMLAGSGLHLIDTEAKTASALFAPGKFATRADKTKFASCTYQ